ncbi:L-serine ammonia-lyase, iron-sulfur-dependent, subunit alpha [Marispirochaeta sp.]|uniref:L-cysteine desulfidase family protein n=1 Tax=Marispirochaeta sp. TaxID=2038653 RepID=UPI0029C807E9|nr:L-serine ammonia-lyase, iron-sulfur-dependent, subunit alpha [Marispirochaeta sp.]
MREQKYIDILNSELVPALGCTEPIAIAYASAKARQVLGEFPDKIDICCSGNIIKNVNGVKVPNSGGLKGVGAAAILGAIGGDPNRELEVLETVTDLDREQTRKLLAEGYFSCKLQKDVENLYIIATVRKGKSSASVTIINRHTLIKEIKKDEKVIYQVEGEKEDKNQKGFWNMTIRDILDFANGIDLDRIKGLLDRQIEMNSAIARKGMEEGFGAQVGRTLLETSGNEVQNRAKAYASSGSDARMGGCSLPVVINSGSGNQGMTVSLPVIEYANEWKVSQEKLYRALLISNLTAIHLKHYIGSLSAFCGAVTAACGAGAAITYMAGGTYSNISHTIINTLANVGGIVCDGAKASCAAKISSALDAAILGYELSMKDRYFEPGEGLIKDDIESTIQSMGYVGRVGMKSTDIEILNVMMNQVDFRETALSGR